MGLLGCLLIGVVFTAVVRSYEEEAADRGRRRRRRLAEDLVWDRDDQAALLAEDDEVSARHVRADALRTVLHEDNEVEELTEEDFVDE